MLLGEAEGVFSELVREERVAASGEGAKSEQKVIGLGGDYHHLTQSWYKRVYDCLHIRAVQHSRSCGAAGPLNAFLAHATTSFSLFGEFAWLSSRNS